MWLVVVASVAIAEVEQVASVQLGTDLASGPANGVHVRVRRPGADRRDELVPFTLRRFPVRPRRPVTSAGRIVPETVPPPGGHGCVPAGPLPRLEQRNTEMPPLTLTSPKWMCAWVAGVSSPLVAQRVADLVLTVVDPGPELARAGGRERRHFLVAVRSPFTFFEPSPASAYEPSPSTAITTRTSSDLVAMRRTMCSPPCRGHSTPGTHYAGRRRVVSAAYTRRMEDWYGIGVSVGTGVALGVLFVALLAALRLGPVVSLVLAVAGAIAVGWFVNDWFGVGGGVIGAALGVLGADLIARGALGRGGTVGGTGFLLASAGIALAALAWVPIWGYVAAVRRSRARTTGAPQGTRALRGAAHPGEVTPRGNT